MTLVLCTIVTPDYVDRALALVLSARRSQSKAEYCVLTTGESRLKVPGVNFLTLNSLCERVPQAAVIHEKYGQDKDRLRWCLKPVLMNYLLCGELKRAVIYADSDVSFVRPLDLLVDLLGDGGVLLTPHWRPIDPSGSTRNFRLNYMDGLFNAGCVAAASSGVPALQWWAEACFSACERKREEGLWDDQRYLDLMPIYFDDTVICRDRGFNLADWNLHLRNPDRNGKRDVPDRWPVSMIHFTRNTIKRIETGGDPLLEPYLNDYRGLLATAAMIIGRGGAAHGRNNYSLPHQLEEAGAVPAVVR